ncbi:hypothetical protein [Solimicrobium silvestre]|uniref:Uncharacterized protein n=1 Tax=Solimicrobium silvestre TaxID=2099400 RepID=A0A2S9H171_9BURK|nr:hypothetical protein [Solimicrobium silvestre]PRC93735.1 hypothetical protein S2091_1736 [Solimicrobium silvestre]
MVSPLFFSKKISALTMSRRDKLPLFSYSIMGMLIMAMLLSFTMVSRHATAQTPASPPASAPAGAGAGAKFADHKTKELARIAHHLEVLQTLQSCVQAANDHAAMKTCNETAKASEHQK